MDEHSIAGRDAPAGLHPETSVFLDLIRFCAALVVAFDHLANYTKNLFWQFGAFGALEFACSALARCRRLDTK